MLAPMGESREERRLGGASAIHLKTKLLYPLFSPAFSPRFGNSS